MSFCRAVTWTSVCHAGLSLSLTPTLRLLKQPLSHSSGPIQYDSPLYGQCGPRFSALRLFVLRVYRRFTFQGSPGSPHTLAQTKRPNSPNALAIIRWIERRRAALSNYPSTYFTHSRCHLGEVVVVHSGHGLAHACMRRELLCISVFSEVGG